MSKGAVKRESIRLGGRIVPKENVFVHTLTKF